LQERYDAISGERVQYLYDELGRLTKAETVGPEWGQTYSYDGFGNLFAKAATKWSGVPTMNILVDQATNRVAGSSGFGYDANGNATAMPGVGLAYDIENRVKSTTNAGGQTEQYRYGADNRRLRVQRAGGAYEYFFYDPDGALVGVYDLVADGGTQKLVWKSMHVSVGGRLCWTGSFDAPMAVVTDRLASVVLRGTTRVRTLPYGEEIAAGTANDKEKFATYWRDGSTGLDYAHNRYYGSAWGRFGAVDKKFGDRALSMGTHFNRYAYGENDPINAIDTDGLDPTFKVNVTAVAPVVPIPSDVGQVLDGVGVPMPEIGDGENIPWDPGVGGGTDPCGEAKEKMDRTIRGEGMPGGKSIMQRVVENLFGKEDLYDDHEKQIMNLIQRLKNLSDEWDDNDCGPRPPGVQQYINELTPAAMRAARDRIQLGFRAAAWLTSGYALYRLARMAPSLLIPPLWPTIPVNIAVP
jgi:RHS repeat-associated protein